MIGNSCGAKLAIDSFNEAINNKGGALGLAKADPAEYNLLNGLANMAFAIGQLEKQVAKLTQEVQTLKARG